MEEVGSSPSWPFFFCYTRAYNSLTMNNTPPPSPSLPRSQYLLYRLRLAAEQVANDKPLPVGYKIIHNEPDDDMTHYAPCPAANGYVVLDNEWN